jgi:hypothetical protein
MCGGFGIQHPWFATDGESAFIFGSKRLILG